MQQAFLIIWPVLLTSLWVSINAALRNKTTNSESLHFRLIFLVFNGLCVWQRTREQKERNSYGHTVPVTWTFYTSCFNVTAAGERAANLNGQSCSVIVTLTIILDHFRVFIYLFISWYKWVNFLVILKWKSLGTNLSHPQVAIVGTAGFFLHFPCWLLYQTWKL